MNQKMLNSYLISVIRIIVRFNGMLNSKFILKTNNFSDNFGGVLCQKIIAIYY